MYCARAHDNKMGKLYFSSCAECFSKEKKVVAAVVFAERNPTVLVEIESVISYSVELPCYPCIACSCRVQTWELGSKNELPLPHPYACRG